MSATEVATAPAAAAATVEDNVKATETVNVPDPAQAESPAAPVAPSSSEEPAAVESKEDPVKHRSRSPFSDLKNRLFHHNSPKDKKAPLEAEPAAASTETPAAANENVEPAAAPEAVEATEPTKEEAATTEKKKAGVFDKVKNLFESKPKKTPAKEDEAAVTETPAVAAAAAEPETTAAAAAAPVAGAAPASAEEAAVANTTAAPTTTTEAAPSEEAAKEAAPPKKEKDLVKLGRRLSARVGQAFSPKREKKDPLAAAGATAAGTTEPATTVTEEQPAPKFDTKIDESPAVAQDKVNAAVETPYAEPSTDGPADTVAPVEAKA